MSQPQIVSSSTTDINVDWEYVSFDGGDNVVSYNLQIDSGPGTAFNAPVTTNLMTYDFTGLTTSPQVYRIQIQAVNTIGAGLWSEPIKYYTAGKPSVP